MKDSNLSLTERVLGRFSFLELSVDLALWTFLYGQQADKFPKAAIVTDRLSFSRKLDLFRDLVRADFGESDTLRKLVKQVKEVSEKRNRLAHSLWMYDSAGQRVMTKMTFKNGVVQLVKGGPPEKELGELDTETIDAANAIKTFMADLGISPQIFPKGEQPSKDDRPVDK